MGVPLKTSKVFCISPLLEKTPQSAQDFAQNRSGPTGVLPHVCEHTGEKVRPDRRPVVLLTRLPPFLSSLPLPASQIPSRGDESSKTSDEDEPQETDDSDVSVSSFITSHKRRKWEQKDEKLDTSPSRGSEVVRSVQNKAGIKHKDRKMMDVTTRPASNKGTVLTSASLMPPIR